MATTKNHHGIIRRSLVPGAFYRCASVGSFQDPSCSLTIPGCTARVDNNGVIIELRLPDRPVQISTHKMTQKMGKNSEDPAEWIETEFGTYCALGIGEALQMAADSGAIVEISDEEMQELWPAVYAQRKDKILFDPRQLKTGTAQSLFDLIEKAKQDRLASARAATKSAHDEAEAAAK